MIYNLENFLFLKVLSILDTSYNIGLILFPNAIHIKKVVLRFGWEVKPVSI